MNQRDRFEAAISQTVSGRMQLAAGLLSTGDYASPALRVSWEWFQKGEASGLELAAKACDETIAGLDKARHAEHITTLVIQRDAIRAFLAREGE